MLDREHIIPIAINENKLPLTTLVGNLHQAEPNDVVKAMDDLLCTTEHFFSGYIETIDAVIAKLYERNKTDEFIQRIFELGLKIYKFEERWKKRLIKKRIHEKHNLRIQSVEINEIPVDKIPNILEIAKVYIDESIYYSRTHILAFCLLHLSGETNIAYNGEDDIFYLISYVFNDTYDTLLLWSSNAKNNNDWSILYLENPPNFIFRELKYIKDIQTLKNIIIQQKSHKIFDQLFIKLTMNLAVEDIIFTLSETYTTSESNYTRSIFKKIFDIRMNEREVILKKFMLKTKSTELADILFRSCEIVDGYFVECCLMCISYIHYMPDSLLMKIINSQYWLFIIKKYKIFFSFMKLIKARNIQNLEKYDILNHPYELTTEYLMKIDYVSRNMPDRKREVVSFMKYAIKKIYKRTLNINDSKNLISNEELDENIISMVYRLYFYLRDPLLSKKYASKLSIINPSLFFHHLCTECNYDQLFINCMNIVLKQLNTTYIWAIKHILNMEIFNRDDFWCITVIKLLKMKYLENYIQNGGIHPGIDKKNTNRLYRLENKTMGSLDNISKMLENTLNLSDTNKSDILSIKPYENDDIVFEINKNSTEDDTCVGFNDMSVISSAPSLKNLDNVEFANNSYMKSQTQNKLSQSMHLLKLDNKSSVESPKNNLKYYRPKTLLKMLINELRKKTLDYKNIKMLINSLKNSSKYSNGAMFNNSTYNIFHEFHHFSLQMSLIQYEDSGEQIFVELKNDKEFIKIGRNNGKLFMEINNNEKRDYVFLKESNDYKQVVEFESVFQSKKFKFKINNISYEAKISSINQILICNKFKGVIYRFILCESHTLKNFMLHHMPSSEFYKKMMFDLEKILHYNSKTGLYFDGDNPYFINGTFNTSIRNVLNNRAFLWRSNTELCNVLRKLRGDWIISEIINDCGIGI